MFTSKMSPVTKDEARRIAANIVKLPELGKSRARLNGTFGHQSDDDKHGGGAHYHRQGSDRVENIHHLNSVSAKLPVLLPKR